MSTPVTEVEERPGSLVQLVRHLRPLAAVLRPYLGYLWATIALGLLAHVLLVAVGAVAALMVGEVATGAGADRLRVLLGVLVALVLAQAAAHFGESYLSHVGAFKALADLRSRAYDALERLAPAYTVNRRSGDLASVAMGDVELLELFFAHTLGPLVVAAVVPLVSVVAVGVVAPPVALALVPFLVLVALVPTWLHRRAEEQGRAEREETGELAARLVEEVQGVRETLVFGAVDRQAAIITRQGRRLRRAQVAHARRSAAERAATDALVTLGVLAALLAGAAMVVGDDLDLALLPVVVVVAASAFVPVTTLGQTALEMGRIGAAAGRLTVLYDARPAVVDRPGAATSAGETRRGQGADGAVAVAFEDVTFRYAPGLPPALSGVTFTVPEGRTVALVGHSGAGKSTCAALLLRLWEVESGAVRIDGVDVRDLTQDALRERVSLIPQETYLFDETVRDNIALGRPNAPRPMVEDAARRALVDEFVDAMPDGWETRLGERGTRLSGGQRQRVAVARALVRDTPVLVLDEAVSSLDAESEDLVRAALAEATSGRTTLVIAHRLTTIRGADHIVVLEGGRVVEQGTFDDLAGADGPFARLLARDLADASRTGAPRT